MRLTDGPVTTLIVEGKRWDPKRVGHVADYRCGRCHGGFTKEFRSKYPSRCPYCRARVTVVMGSKYVVRGSR